MKPISSRKPHLAIAAITVASSLAVLAIAPSASASPGPTHSADAAAFPSSPAARIDWASRATASYTALQDSLYLGAAGHGLYRENLDSAAGANPYSYLWEYREATQAAVDMQGIPRIGAAYRPATTSRFASLQQYFGADAAGAPGYQSYLPAPLGAGGDVYYDDNAVVGLSLFDQFHATGDSVYLTKSKQAFDIVSRGWNDDSSLGCPGGMDWIDSPSNTTRGANVTGLAAQLAAHLFEQTRDRRYLAWSTKLFDWNNRCLLQSPGLYENSRSTDGTVDPTLWTYNSGAMIATATLLYRSTGDRTYLKEARAAADASLAYWSVGDRLQKQPAIFNAFYVKDLLLLDSVSPNASYRKAIASYADAAWKNNRDASTGLFHFQPSGGGDYDASRPAATLDQAAMVQIFAALAWKPGTLGSIE